MTIWNQFMSAQEAEYIAQSPAISEPTWVPLLKSSLIAIQGPDAKKFLQGQVTCDINQLSESNFIRGAQCTLKGRVILSFSAFSPSLESVLLRINSDLLDKAATNLKKYMVFSKATFLDLHEDYVGIWIKGAALASQIATVFDLKLVEGACAHAEKLIAANIRADEWEFWIAVNEFAEKHQQLLSLTKPSPLANRVLADIQAGEPDISLASYELFTPHSLNYPLTQAVNFKKGCYTGQEIVARMHYRGNLQKHAYRFEVDLHLRDLPAIGSAMTDSNGSNKGELILAAAVSEEKTELLAYVNDSDIQDLYLNHQKLRVLPLPYAIPVTQE